MESDLARHQYTDKVKERGGKLTGLPGTPLLGYPSSLHFLPKGAVDELAVEW